MLPRTLYDLGFLMNHATEVRCILCWYFMHLLLPFTRAVDSLYAHTSLAVSQLNTQKFER